MLVETLRPLLVTGGCATAVLASLTAWSQRHLKRLLAFSTISHLGIMLAGAASMTAAGASGFALYLVGHGLVKGALFMVAGILLALCSSPDELVLYRQGRRYWPAGIVMGAAGLMLAGLPFGPLHAGTELIHHATGTGLADWAISTGEVLTGGAVLRAALRIFAGWSGQPGVETTSPTVRERETPNRPFAFMLAPAALLVAGAFVPAGGLRGQLAHGFAAMTGKAQALALPPAGAGVPWEAVTTVALGVGVVAITLVRTRPTRPLARRLFTVEKAPFAALEFLHSGLIGDYIAWVGVGLATLAAWIGAR